MLGGRKEVLVNLHNFTEQHKGLLSTNSFHDMSESFPFKPFHKASTREVERKGDGVCSRLPEGTIRVLSTAKEMLSSLINRLEDMYDSFVERADYGPSVGLFHPG